MFSIFMWNGSEDICIKQTSDRTYLRNLMEDPVWETYEMSYLAW